MTERGEKMAKELRKLVSEFLARHTNKTSLITITNLKLSNDFKNGTVYLTVLPRDKEQAGISFVRRHLHDIREYLKKHMKTRTIPFLSIEIDQGEINRQKIDDLLRHV